MNPGELHVWRIALDRDLPSRLTPTDDLRRRHRNAHAALRAILEQEAERPIAFEVSAAGKPWLPSAPRLKFNLARSQEMALVAVALDVEVGVDVERFRPLPDAGAIAERFFPPSEAAAFAQTPAEQREREFFRYWTRFEAILKATGRGLYGAGQELEGEWTVQEIDAGEGYAAAVAAPCAELQIRIHDFGGE